MLPKGIVGRQYCFGVHVSPETSHVQLQDFLVLLAALPPAIFMYLLHFLLLFQQRNKQHMYNDSLINCLQIAV